MQAPKFYANTVAASLPLGSINPYNKSSIVIHYLDYNYAVVPRVPAAFIVTLK
jgi:hypothetical protein